jgi:hypothetical protein
MSNSNPETMMRAASGPRLIAQEGSEQGRSFAIPPTGLLVGRAAECDLALDDAEISRRHARFYWRGTQLLVEDLGSANGTVVNGQSISGPRPLSERDLVALGKSVFIVQGLVSRELTPTARNLDAVAPAASPYYAVPPRQTALQRGPTFWLILAGLGLAFLLAVGGIGALWYFNQAPAVSQAPAVTILTPANGAQVEINVPLIVQATATDARGVTRLELWADGGLVSQQASPVPQGASPLLLNMSWTPPAAGNHVLEVRAFNSANQQSLPAVVTVNVAAGTVTPVGEIAATATPVPTDAPTATAPAIILFTPTAPVTVTPPPTTAPQAGLQAVADVNVRGGPGTFYPILGLLRAGDVAPVVGRSQNGAWWQIIFPPNTNNVGWVVNSYTQANEAANNVPVVAGPPAPPTHTPPPPAATNTPLPSAEVTFTADTTELNQGQCTRLRWRVRNVAAYFVDGVAGAGDEGDREVCDPVGTATHTLRINRRDGSTQEFTATINVRSTTVPRPGLISPDDNEEFNYPDEEVTFSWSSVSAPGTITYNIEIQSEDDGDWENWRTINGLTGTSYRMDDFAGPRPGRWRVWATSSTLGDSDRTGWREFNFEE